MSRAPLLGRLARRYALRHKGQTVRALLGLLVATTVLVVGLGLGESIATSLEEEAMERFGPIDVTLQAARPFPAVLAAQLAAASGARGAASFNVLGAVANGDTDLAEAFATIRGVSAAEAQALGPLPGAPEPGPGEVVLSQELAERLQARPGHVLRLRAAPPDAEGAVNLTTAVLVGATGVPEPLAPRHNLTVRSGALGLGAEVAWRGDAGELTLVAVAPDGMQYANKSAQSPAQLVVEGPLAEGEWVIRVTSQRPVLYTGGAGVAYLPASLDEATVVLEARVAGIAREEGRAAITGRPAALVPIEDLQRALGQPGNATHAYYTVGARDPYAAVDAMKRALPAGNVSGFEVRADKAETLKDAAEAGADITGFLLGMGGFTLLAAILLAFTLFSALVEERRSELGIMRALGLTRGEVAAAMTMEGALYAFAAAVVGLLLGLVILLVGVTMLGNAASAEGGPDFAFHVQPRTMLLSLVIGAGLPLATIAVASLRFARLDPARAIRGIPDDPKGNRRAGVWVAGALILVGLLLSIGPIGRLLGLPVAIAGLAALAWSLKRPLVGLALAGAGVALVVYTLFTFTAFPEDAGELDPILTLSRAAVLALGGAALAVASARPYRRLAAWLSRGRAQRPSFVALRYLVARRRPAGLTMAMISIVVVIVTVMGTLFSVFSATIPEEEAGNAVFGESPLVVETYPRPPPADVASQIERADFLPRHVGFRQANVTVDGRAIDPEFGFRQYLGVTEGFARANEYELRALAPGYASAEEAWVAVAQGTAFLLPDWAAEENGLEPGDRVLLDHPNAGRREYVLAGSVRSQFAFQTFVAADHVRAMGFPQGTQVYVRVAEGGDPNVVAHRLTALYAEDGLSFTSIPEEVARISATIQALVLVFEAFLALGLFVGLAATGFLASRAVHERMRDIGTLRALGFEEKDVRRAFVLESTLTAGIGLLIGTGVGLLVAASIWWREVRDEGAAFRPPWLLMAAFSAAVLGLAALASNGPSKRAARLPPAIAVRHVE